MNRLKKKIQNNSYYVIAEIGMNHDGNFSMAKKLIDAAGKTGVDAVKFQMHIAEAETIKNAPRPPYFQGEDRFKFFKRTAFTEREWRLLRIYCHRQKLDFIVSPFSTEAAMLLEKIGVDAYKIPSGEVTNHPYLEYINTTMTPVIMSSGMSDWREMNQAVKILKNSLAVLMQCSSQYPCAAETVGLNIIEEMKKKYRNLIIGFSDHTLDNTSSIAALIKGATVFEKHFTLSKKSYGPDAKFSLEPKEMKKYVQGIDFISRALKNPVDKNNLRPYYEMKKVFEKNIIINQNLPKNHKLILEDISFKKAGRGIRADQYKKVIGKKLKHPKKQEDVLLSKDLI